MAPLAHYQSGATLICVVGGGVAASFILGLIFVAVGSTCLAGSDSHCGALAVPIVLIVMGGLCLMGALLGVCYTALSALTLCVFGATDFVVQQVNEK